MRASSGPPADAIDVSRSIHQEPKTSKKHPEHKIYPYPLKGLAITRPNQVWCTDISHIPMRRGFPYLVAIMNWHSRIPWRRAGGPINLLIDIEPQERHRS